MALGDGVAGEGVLAVVDMDIAAADADLLNPDQHLVIGDFGDRNLPEDHFMGCGHNLLKHHFVHSIGLLSYYQAASRTRAR